MKVLIKGATIVDTNSSYHLQNKNILIDNGQIVDISNHISDADEVIEAEGMCLSIGWLDMRVNIGEPGYEHKEDIYSACKAAMAGGYTEIVSMPNTNPIVASKNVISFIKSKSEPLLVNIHPTGAVTQQLNGKEITEMMDMHDAGAIAFTDGELPIWHSDVLLKTLQYLQKFDGLLINHAEDNQISHYGQMNESIESTMLGLKGIPKIAEELMVERDLNILQYTGGKIHFAHISSPKSVQLITKAKVDGLNVTCDIAAYQLVLDDSLIKTFDTNLKVNPPLRTKADIELLTKALLNNEIDCICTDHIPQDTESKNLEYDLAEFGMIGLETTYGILNKTLNLHDNSIFWVQKVAYNPREILNLDVPKIEINQKANLTLFDSKLEWVFDSKDIKSKSHNSPFVGMQLKGRAKAVFNNCQFHINY